MTKQYRCWAEVDLNALRENLAQIRNVLAPAKRVLTVVKADAYGHGLRQIAAILMQSGTDIFGVANLAEARAIRSVGKGWPVLMLGACLPSEIDHAVRDEVMATVSSLEEAKGFSAAAKRLGKTAWVHLKINTGMGRLGIAPDQAGSLLQAIRELPAVEVKGLCTHYSSAEDDAEFTQRQRASFAALVQALAHQAGGPFEWLHASSSGGLLLEPDSLCNTVRPGLLVYGVVPKGKRPIDRRFAECVRPALTWKCQVSLVRQVPAGTPISYGHTYLTPKSMHVAIVTAGYGDGYLRAGSHRAQVLIGRQRCAVLGRVTMDQMVVDVTAVPDVRPGDEVVLIGQQGQQQITANDLAEWCHTIPWEVLTNITYRVPRIYRGSHAA